ERLADAEGRTSAALESLRGSLAELDQRLSASGGGVRAEFQQRLETPAAELTHRIEGARGELAAGLATGTSPDVQARIDRLAIDQVGGEIARIAGAVESRLSRIDQLHAEALERLGSEIGRTSERLTERILQSERRAAQAIDDVGEQVAKVTERIEQRHERASS